MSHGDWLLCIAWERGGEGGFKAKQGETDLADPPFECYFTEVIHLITFDDFRGSPIPPHALIFQANFSGSSSESYQSFQRCPLLGSQSRLADPLFCSPKNQVIPPKILRPPPRR